MISHETSAKCSINRGPTRNYGTHSVGSGKQISGRWARRSCREQRLLLTMLAIRTCIKRSHLLPIKIQILSEIILAPSYQFKLINCCMQEHHSKLSRHGQSTDLQAIAGFLYIRFLANYSFILFLSNHQEKEVHWAGNPSLKQQQSGGDSHLCSTEKL